MPLELNTYLDIERIAFLEKVTKSMGSSAPDIVVDINPTYTKPKTTVTSDACINAFDLRVQKYYCNVLNGLNSDELEVFKKIIETHSRVSHELKVDVTMDVLALLHAFNLYRKIRALTHPEKTRILEVSSGTGYLGYILFLFGYKLCTTEHASDFYVYQNRMWGYLSENQFIELASKDNDMGFFQAINDGDVIHVPWWAYLNVDQHVLSSKFDLLISHIKVEEHSCTYSDTVSLTVEAFNKSEKINFYLIDTFPRPRSDVEKDGLSTLGLSPHKNTYKEFFTKVVISPYASERFSTLVPSLEQKPSMKNPKRFFVAFRRLTKENIINLARLLNPIEIFRLGGKCIRMIFMTGGVKLVGEHAKSYLYGTTLVSNLSRYPMQDLPDINHFSPRSRKLKTISNTSLSPVVRDLEAVIDRHLKTSMDENKTPFSEFQSYLRENDDQGFNVHSSYDSNSWQMVKTSTLDFIFMHPSRVGGSCVAGFFSTLYPELCRFNLTNYPQLFIPPDWVKANMEWLLTISPYKAVVCNYYVSVEEIAKIDSSTATITILRDPIERICSEFLEYRRTVAPYIDLADSDIIPYIQDVLIFADHFHRNNFYVRFFSRTGLLDILGKEEYDVALCNLKQLSYVGVTEKMERVISTICAWLPKESPINMREAQVGAKSLIEGRSEISAGAEMAAQLTSSARDQLLKQNSMDYNLYNIFRKQISI